MLSQLRHPIWQLAFRTIIPITLLIVTLGIALSKGMVFFGGMAEDRLVALLLSASFVFPLLLAMGAHPLAHFLIARRHKINAYPPYFIPDTTLYGINGAYTKLSWPIQDRRALVQIFTAGPIAGCVVSAIFLLFGLAMSSIQPNLEGGGIKLGDFLFILGAEQILFPEISEDQDIMLHPVAFAGWIGIYFNLWQLFPAGRLDGGRLAYALWGYKKTVIISWVTIAGLVVLAVVWEGWLYIAIFAAITMIRLRRQYPIESHERGIDPSSIRLIWITLVIFSLIFTPVPVSVLP